MSLLTTIKRTPQPKLDSGRGILVCLIGLPGVGKSSLLAQFPNAEFIVDKRDQGILDLMDYSAQTKVQTKRKDVSVCDNYLEMRETLAAAVSGDKQTIILESLVGIQSFCDDYTMSVDYNQFGDKARHNFINYRNGLSLSANSHFQVLLDLMILGQNRGKNMFITGHSKLGTGKAVVEDDWVSQILENGPEFSRRISATFATILHIGVTFPTTKTGNKSRASGDVVSKIYTNLNPHFPAKNRMALSVDIDYPNDPELAYLCVADAFRLDPKTGIRRPS